MCTSIFLKASQIHSDPLVLEQCLVHILYRPIHFTDLYFPEIQWKNELFMEAMRSTNEKQQPISY